MKRYKFSNSQIINGIALGFSLSFLISAWIAAIYTKEWGMVFTDWHRILITPCPLITDYFAIGGLASTMLNAGICGMSDLRAFYDWFKGRFKGQYLGRVLSGGGSLLLRPESFKYASLLSGSLYLSPPPETGF